jgi:peptidoglycan/LPS O-acetylase OafA/YrhL
MRIEALTFYRFIAATMVVAHHFGSGLVSFTMANQMVTFFFVLSGFVMTITYYSKVEVSLRSFAVNRISRIVPLYLIALALAICFPLLPSGVTAISILLNMTLLQSWFPPYPRSINAPGWSLSVEMFFYLCFPFVLSNMKKISPSGCIMGAVIFWGFTQVFLANLLNSGLYTQQFSLELIYYLPLSHFCSFVLGMSGASLFLKNKESWHIPTFLSLTLITSITIMIFFHFKIEEGISYFAGYKLKLGGSFYAPVFLALILVTSLSDNFFTKILSFRLPVLLGEASYSMYILQVPIFTLYRDWVGPIFYVDTPNWFDPSFHINTVQNFILFLLFLTAISIISFFWVESLGKRLVHRVFSR